MKKLFSGWKSKLIFYLSIQMSTLNANALPFHPNAASFTRYANSQWGKWSDPSLIVYFSNLGNCTYDYFAGQESYSCRSGYARIKDGFSSRVCRISVEYEKSNGLRYQEGQCRPLKLNERCWAISCLVEGLLGPQL
jgi:hypothetical protein